MLRFSMLAGPLKRSPSKGKYAVDFTNVISYDRLLYRNWTRIVACGAFMLALGFGIILFQPAHWIVVQQPTSSTHIENWIMLIFLGLLQCFLIVGTLAAARSTLKAKDPIPVQPPYRLRTAFVTTRAPGEPISMVQTTLEAAMRVRYSRGSVDVWLLDETNDPELVAICNKLGVRYFSRFGITRWNTKRQSRILFKRGSSYLRWLITFGTRPIIKRPTRPNLFFAAKSKHGNFNAWREYLADQGITYDILAGVDTDHVPEPNYLERLLGYFHDPDVAYVVGPQVYGNYEPGLRGLVARWAESQASFFQSTIQRAANAGLAPMFVGTNYAVRMIALDQVGGFQPCITEDMATGLTIHAKRNPSTGNHWKFLYTTDVLAVGEGPELWGPYFTQQWRWAAGTFDTWQRTVWRVFFRLPSRAKLHYFLILTYSPLTAMSWLLGMISSMIYLTTGATAILAPWGEFASLSMMTVVMQLGLYFWNRRNNVSPHEPEGSYGVPGIVLSTLAAPIYLSALIGVLLGKKPHFVVTTKGQTDSVDKLPAFRIHLQWAAVLLLGLFYGFTHRHHHIAMLVGVFAQLIICLAPFVLGMTLSLRTQMRKHLSRKQLVTKGESL